MVLKNMLIVSDLDGTLIGRNSHLSSTTRESFQKARRAGAICAIATGRSLRGAEEVLDSAFPLDYLIFSSGAGVLDWKSKTLLHKTALDSGQVRGLHDYLSSQGLDYTIQLETPDSHLFLHSPLKSGNLSFADRINHHKSYALPLNEAQLPLRASEFIVVDSNQHSSQVFEKIHSALSRDFNVVRATSPFDGASVWIEIFHLETSKALASDFLRRLHQKEIHETYALGNDYNDLQLLSWAGNSLVVGDAVPLLIEKYHAVKNHSQDAFVDALEIWMKKRKK